MNVSRNLVHDQISLLEHGCEATVALISNLRTEQHGKYSARNYREDECRDQKLNERKTVHAFYEFLHVLVCLRTSISAPKCLG